MKRRVVLTGLGSVTSIGSDLDAFWAGLLECKSGVGPIEAFDSSQLPVHIAAEVKDFDPRAYLSPKEARHSDRFVQFAIAAVDGAIRDSGLDLEAEDTSRAGCIWASGIGGLHELETTVAMILEKGPRRISPFFIPKLMVNAAAGQIAIRHKLHGANYGVTSACASAQHALGLSLRTIQYGDADVVITGGSEATVTVSGVGGFCALKALSQRNDDPKTASRPFNADRDGFVVGEGAGALVFEEYERAKRRGARIYAEVLGFGMTDDGYHISAPIPEGTQASRAMRLCLEEAGCNPDEVNYINAHGTSTPLNDVMETRAIRAAFGKAADDLMVSSTKSQIGHLLGASGAVESVVVALALHHQVAPATINYITPDPECDLDYVPNEPRETELRRAMTNSFGFGGHNVAMLFGTV